MMQKLDELKEKYDINEYKQPEINIPNFKYKKGIILLVGSSGSGKSTILKNITSLRNIDIKENISVIENFSNLEKAENLLLSVGLRSIPTWFRKITELSNGERHRAECALALDQGINCIDEFTSVVDRNTAKSLSFTFHKYFSSFNIDRIFIASCHRDIIDWLQPDHIYDTDSQQFLPKGLDRRPPIKLQIKASSYEDWIYFKKHHYLDSSMNTAVHCYTAYIEDMQVAFLSVIHGCSRDIKSYWRECRLVVLPEFQGLGIGKTLSNLIGEEYASRGLRYFSKTSHPALGNYRNNSNLWRNTSTNMMKRPSYIKKDGSVKLSKNYGNSLKNILRDFKRLTFSHEYIGEGFNEKLIKIKSKSSDLF